MAEEGQKELGYPDKTAHVLGFTTPGSNSEFSTPTYLLREPTIL